MAIEIPPLSSSVNAFSALTAQRAVESYTATVVSDPVGGVTESRTTESVTLTTAVANQASLSAVSATFIGLGQEIDIRA